MKVKAGVPVHFHSKEGRQTMGRIVDCQPIGSNPQNWKLGAQLDEPDNFWGLNPCPEDWARLHKASNGSAPQPANGTSKHGQGQVASRGRVAESAQQQFSEDHLQTMVAHLLQPLQANLVELREKLAQRQGNASRFEVSLSQIPPELEEKLWARLSQDIGQRTLQLTREEANRVLSTAHAAIGQELAKTQEQLQQRIEKVLSAAEQRTQTLAEGVADGIQQQLRAGMEHIEQQVAEAEAHLKNENETLLKAFSERLNEEYRANYQEMQRMRDSLAEEWSRLREQLAGLNNRLAQLDASSRRLESDFEARLGTTVSDSVSAARAQLQDTLDMLLKELRTRNAQELASQLDEAYAQLTRAQNEMEASISESLQAKVGERIEAFGQSMEQLAQDSAGRWRLALAKDLNSIAKLLGQQLRIDALNDAREREQGKTR
jgi:hypothetical protein